MNTSTCLLPIQLPYNINLQQSENVNCTKKIRLNLLTIYVFEDDSSVLLTSITITPEHY